MKHLSHHDSTAPPRTAHPANAEVHEISTSRLEAFSDGVFAIAITLLVLEIELPHDRPLLDGLLALWPSYAAYVFSFLIIGVVWMNHHTMLFYIRRVDRPLLLMNLLLLMNVAFIPFSTHVLAEGLASGHGERAAAVFYGLTLTVGGLPFNAIWWYASRGHRHLSHLITPQQAATIRSHFSMGPLLYLGATLVGLLSAVASLTCFAVLIVFYMVEVLGSRTEVTEAAAPGHAAVTLPLRAHSAREPEQQPHPPAAPAPPALVAAGPAAPAAAPDEPTACKVCGRADTT
ncbi:TMEM175 family protein [Streptomyces sp. NPDC058955]|uniref:TMEM175 family protein n=1 Tax=unclassified Streptomyces TaxID=2593676 RepID=UPI003656262A